MTAARKLSPEMEALKLWDQLRYGLLMAQDAIQAIIDQKAWEPLGYGSFFEAWSDKMGDITLAREITIHVVYQMLAEGLDADAISATVKGIGPETAKNLTRERANGVPAELASGVSPRRREWPKPILVDSHFRNEAAPASKITIDVGPTMHAEYVRIAARLGRSVGDIAKEAVTQRFQELA